MLLCAVVVALVGAGCSGDDSSTRPPAELPVDQIAPAVHALEARLGGPQRYTEINAATEGVNLFVAVGGDQEQGWFYRGGQLEPPTEAKEREGAPFDLTSVTIDVGPKLVQQVEQQFPGATVTGVALLDVEGQGLVWALRSKSAKGGELNLFYGPDGTLRAVSPNG